MSLTIHCRLTLWFSRRPRLARTGFLVCRSSRKKSSGLLDPTIYLCRLRDSLPERTVRRRFRYATLPIFVASALIGGGLLTGQGIGDPQTVTIKNPTKRTRASIAAGKKAYDINCASCHGKRAEGAEKAGTPISIIEEQGGRQPPDLTDSKWDHGSTDDSIYTTIEK